MSCWRVITRPALRSSNSNNANSFKGSATGRPSTVTVCAGTCIRTGPATRSVSIYASLGRPRRSTAWMRAMSSRDE
jgi:hypothetical protein